MQIEDDLELTQNCNLTNTDIKVITMAKIGSTSSCEEYKVGELKPGKTLSELQYMVDHNSKSKNNLINFKFSQKV